MRFALPFLLVCATLVAAVLVLGAFARPGEVGPLPDLTLRDPRGRSFDLASMDGRVWVASFLGAGCIDGCAGTIERLSRLHDGLPDTVPLVTFVVDGTSLWPTRPAAAENRRDWIFCQGNDVDADSETEVRRLATEFLRVPASDLAGLGAGVPAAVVVPVDDRGRPLGVYTMERAAPGDNDPALAGAWGDVEFRTVLHRHAGREARWYAIVLLLVVAGLVLARRGLVRIHPVCTALAAAITMALVGSGFGYVDFAVSVPFRGSGWARPLYLSVLATHTALTALIVVLALSAIYHAARRRFARHTAMTRWLAPAWIGVALSGAVIYSLLSIWFPGA